MARKALGVILARDASCADLGGSSKYSGEAPVRLFGSQSNLDSTSRQVEPVARKALGVILARAAGCADLGGSSKYSGGGGLSLLNKIVLFKVGKTWLHPCPTPYRTEIIINYICHESKILTRILVGASILHCLL